MRDNGWVVWLREREGVMGEGWVVWLRERVGVMGEG